MQSTRLSPWIWTMEDSSYFPAPQIPIEISSSSWWEIRWQSEAKKRNKMMQNSTLNVLDAAKRRWRQNGTRFKKMYFNSSNLANRNKPAMQCIPLYKLLLYEKKRRQWRSWTLSYYHHRLILLLSNFSGVAFTNDRLFIHVVAPRDASLMHVLPKDYCDAGTTTRDGCFASEEFLDFWP